MTEIEKAIKHFENMRDDAVIVLSSGFGTHPGESDLLYRNRKLYAGLAVTALREKQEREKGCGFCRTEHTDWGEGGAHDFRIHGDTLSYFDHVFGWEGVKVRFCPICGRPLPET